MTTPSDSSARRLLEGKVALVTGGSIERTASRVPVVLVHRSVDAIGVAQIEVDNTAGGRLVAKLFIVAGRRLPAIVAGDRALSTVHAREDGFCAAMKRRRPATLVRLRVGFASYEEGYRVAQELSREDRPVAVAAASTAGRT